MASKQSLVESKDISLSISGLYLKINKKRSEFSNITLTRIMEKLVASQEFLDNIDKPLNKEIFYLILWSCLNEISSEILDDCYPELRFKGSEPIKPIKGNSNYRYSYPYEVKRYLLTPSEMECSLYTKSTNNSNVYDIRKISFYVQAYLLEQHVNAHTRLLFDYLNKIRNRLSLIHGCEGGYDIRQSSKSIDFVTLEDCRWMVTFLELIFDISSCIEQDHKFFKNKKGKTMMDNFNVNGIVSELITSEDGKGKTYYKLVLAYVTKQGNTERMSIVVDKSDFETLKKDENVSVDFYIRYNDKYNNIYSRRITKLVIGPCYEQKGET